jgi:hypothetical protein
MVMKYKSYGVVGLMVLLAFSKSVMEIFVRNFYQT